MINRYKRTARTFAELNLGELAPLNEALSDLVIGHGLDPNDEASPETVSEPTAYTERARGFEPRGSLGAVRVSYSERGRR